MSDRRPQLSTARIGLSVGVGAVAGAVFTVPFGWPIVALAAAIGALVTATVVAIVSSHRPVAARDTRRIDPFTIGEPWRNLIMACQSAQRRLTATVDATAEGPLRDSLAAIARRLDHGIVQAWEVAQAGDELDDSLRRLEPARLQSNLAAKQSRLNTLDDPTASAAEQAAIDSLTKQIATAQRLQARSAQIAADLRLTQTQLDELVARANDVKLGATTPETYRSEVDELVVELEALHHAVAEVRHL